MMDINAIVQMAAKMFPSVKITEAVQQAQQMIQGTNNDLSSARNKAKEIGLDSNFVNQFYSQYGNTAQAKMLCSFLGTTPESIRDDALNLVGGNPTVNNSFKNSKMPTSNNKFPHLK